MSDEPKPRRRWGRWLGGGIGVAVMLIVMTFAVYDQSMRGGMNGLGRELDASDPGWRLEEILAARPELDDADNSVKRILAVAAALPPGWPDKTDAKTLEGVPPNALLNAGQDAAMKRLLTGLPREKARELIRFPRGRFEMSGSGADLWRAVPEVEQVNRVITALDHDSQALALEGRTDDALTSARVMLSLGRSLDDDPAPMAHWMRMTARLRGFAAVERALALGEPSDAALAKLAGDPGPASAVLSLRTERAMWHQTLTEVGRGDMDASVVTRSFGLTTPQLFEYGGSIVRREWVRREHLQLLRLMTRWVKASRLPPAEQFAEDEAIEREFQSASGVFTKVAGALLRGVNAHGRRVAAAGAAFEALVAVERYRLKNKKWPAKLDDVVPDFLDKAPIDPIDGKPLRYKRTADGVVLYSIGNDRADDGGDVAMPFKDFGYRLWDTDKRRTKP